MIKLLRSNADLRALFLAQVISFMGDWFVFVAITGMVKDATDSAFLVSLAYVSFTLPAFLATPISGSMVDRFDRRRLVMVVSALQAIAAMGLLTASVHHVWPLFVFQGCISSLAAFVKPSIDAGVPNLARNPEELRAANVLFGREERTRLRLLDREPPAVARAAGDEPPVAPHAELDPLQPRRRQHDGAGGQFDREASQCRGEASLSGQEVDDLVI